MQDEATKIKEVLEKFSAEYGKRKAAKKVVYEEGKCIVCDKEGIKISNLKPFYLCPEHIPLFFDATTVFGEHQKELIGQLKLTAEKLGFVTKPEYLVRLGKSRGHIDLVIQNADGNFGIEVINDIYLPRSKKSRLYRKTVNYSRRKIKILGRGAIVFTNYLNKVDENFMKKLLSNKRIKIYR